MMATHKCDKKGAGRQTKDTVVKGKKQWMVIGRVPRCSFCGREGKWEEIHRKKA